MASSMSGSTSSEVLQDPTVMGKAYENLNRAQAVQNFNPIPFMGPSVAAINPMQQAGMQSAMDAGAAFGLAAPTNVGAMLPKATDYGNGLKAYSAFPIFEQGMAQAREAYPDQMSLFDRFQAATRTPVGGTANYDQIAEAVAGQTGQQTPTAGVQQAAQQYYGGTQPTAQQAGQAYGGQTGTDPMSQIGIGGEWGYTAGDRTNDKFLTDAQKGKINFEAVRFKTNNKQEAQRMAEQYFVNQMGIFDDAKAMNKYLSIVPSENSTYRFEYNNGSFWDKVKPIALGLGVGALTGGIGGLLASGGTGAVATGLGGLASGVGTLGGIGAQIGSAGLLGYGGAALGAGLGAQAGYDAGKTNLNTSSPSGAVSYYSQTGGSNPYLTGIGSSVSNPYLQAAPQQVAQQQALPTPQADIGLQKFSPAEIERILAAQGYI